MTKMDLRKEWRELYGPSAKAPSLVTAPPMHFLMLDGQGGPETSSYQEAIEALYALSYALKFAVKRADGVDYAVMPLEGLWWIEGADHLDMRNRDAWLWTAMIMQPEYVTDMRVTQALTEVCRKKGLSACDRVRYRVFDEGLSAQILHIGPYSDEGPTIARLHAYIAERGYAPAGKHHEIYLSDPRRSAPEKLRTILRQPVASAQ